MGMFAFPIFYLSDYVAKDSHGNFTQAFRVAGETYTGKAPAYGFQGRKYGYTAQRKAERVMKIAICKNTSARSTYFRIPRLSCND